MRRTPALIVGGGPAGAALALLMARAGLPHLLLERSRETGDAICGGFLSWRTLAMLERLGVPSDALNPQPVRRLRLFAGKRSAEAPLPNAARAVSRRHLDTMLLDAAIAGGASVERGVTVRTIGDRTVGLADSAAVTADTLFLASGKHDIRGAPRPAAGRDDDPTLGLRVRLAPGPALDRLVGDAIELHLVDRGYAGLVRQEDGSGNLCMAIRRSRLHEASDPDRLLAALAAELPPLGDRLALRVGGSADAIANVPYGWRARSTEPWLFRLGDQAGVIPSLAGEGMAIALASAFAAAAAYRTGERDAALPYQRAFAARLRRPIGIAATAWHAAERPPLASLAVLAAAVFPGLPQLIARSTRVRM